MKTPSMPYRVALGLAVSPLLLWSATALAEPSRQCQYDPTLGQPNPLGMRAFVTLTEAEGHTTVLFEQFPSPIGDGEVPVTIASTRTLTFYETTLEEARQLLLHTPGYYSELVGYEDPEGFGPVNAVLTCSP